MNQTIINESILATVLYFGTMAPSINFSAPETKDKYWPGINTYCAFQLTRQDNKAIPDPQWNAIMNKIFNDKIMKNATQIMADRVNEFLDETSIK